MRLAFALHLQSGPSFICQEGNAGSVTEGNPLVAQGRLRRSEEAV